jgi:hypothetical protein
MSNNIKRPASETAKSQKLLLFPKDPLIGVLKPDHYIIVDPGSLKEIQKDILTNPEDYVIPDEEPAEEPSVFDFEPPNLDDIKFISKKIFTDKNKNQFVDFVFEIKNHVGQEVVGVNGYGQ